MYLALQKNANGSFRVIDQLIDEEEYILFPFYDRERTDVFPTGRRFCRTIGIRQNRKMPRRG